MKTIIAATCLVFLIACDGANAQLSATTTLGGNLSAGQDRTTGVTAGNYTCPNVTVDSTGRLTSISNGSCSGSGGGGRTLLVANQNYYFNCASGSDTTGNGTSANPWATPVKAYQVAQQTLDLAGQYKVIANSQATCTGVNWSFTGDLPPGSFGLGSFVVEGANFTGIVSIGDGTTAGFPQIDFDNATYTPSASSFGVNVGIGRVIFTGTTYLTTALNAEILHVVTTGSTGAFNGTVYLSSSSGALTGIGNAEDGAVIFPGYWGANWIFNGYPSWSQFAFQSDYNGVIDWSGATCSGGYTGPASRGVAGGQVLGATGCP